MSNSRTLLVLAICMAVSPVGLLILTPALPAIRETFAASLSETQAVLSAYSITLAVGMLLCGPLADRYDKKMLLIVGTGIMAIGSLLAYIASSIEILILARSIQGFGAATASIIPRAIVAEIYKDDDLNRAMSIMIMFVVIGPMIAPIAGGYMVDAMSWREIMLLLLLCAGLSGLTAVAFVQKSKTQDEKSTSIADSIRDQIGLFGNRDFMLNMTVLCAMQIAVYVFLAASPFLVIEMLGFSAAQYGYVFVYLTLGYLIGNFVSGLVVKKIGGVRLVFFATVIFVAGLAILAILSAIGPPSLGAIVGPAILLTIANGITQPNCAAGAMSSVEGRKGAAASLSGFGQIMAAAIGVQLSGFLGVASLGAMLITVLACGLVALVTSMFLVAQQKTPSPASDSV